MDKIRDVWKKHISEADILYSEFSAVDKYILPTFLRLTTYESKAIFTVSSNYQYKHKTVQNRNH